MAEFNQHNYVNQWQKDNLERIAFTVPKGEREKIKAHAQSRGYKSTNAYLYDLIKEDMKKERPGE